MAKFKVTFDWSEHVRGYDEVEVEADTEEQARNIAKREVDWDISNYTKTLDSDWNIVNVEEIFNLNKGF